MPLQLGQLPFAAHRAKTTVWSGKPQECVWIVFVFFFSMEHRVCPACCLFPLVVLRVPSRSVRLYSPAPRGTWDAVEMTRAQPWGCATHFGVGGVMKLEILCPASEAEFLINNMFTGFPCSVLLFACLSTWAQESSQGTFPFCLLAVSLSGCQSLCLVVAADGGCVA